MPQAVAGVLFRHVKCKGLVGDVPLKEPPHLGRVSACVDANNLVA